MARARSVLRVPAYPVGRRTLASVEDPEPTYDPDERFSLDEDDPENALRRLLGADEEPCEPEDEDTTES